LILLDTSAIYALADVADPNHREAVTLFRHALNNHEQLLVHSYVLSESAALIQHRLGLQAALSFLRDSSRRQLLWVAEAEHEAGAALLEQEGRRDLSLVDCVSFALMRRLGIQTSFAFDTDFQRAGFIAYAG